MPRRRHSYIRGDTFNPLESSLVINISSGGDGSGDGAWTCTANTEVGDVVFISGVDDDTLDRANASSTDALPAVAIIVSKPTSTSCTARYTNEYTFAGRAPLIPGAIYYVSGDTPGKIFTPSEVVDLPANLQPVGRAKNQTVILLGFGTSLPIENL